MRASGGPPVVSVPTCLASSLSDALATPSRVLDLSQPGPPLVLRGVRALSCNGCIISRGALGLPENVLRLEGLAPGKAFVQTLVLVNQEAWTAWPLFWGGCLPWLPLSSFPLWSPPHFLPLCLANSELAFFSGGFLSQV